MLHLNLHHQMKNNLLFKFSNCKIDKDCNDHNECAIDECDVELSTCFHHASSLWSWNATTSTTDDNSCDNDVDYYNEHGTDYECYYDDACYEFYENNDNDDSIVALNMII